MPRISRYLKQLSPPILIEEPAWTNGKRGVNIQARPIPLPLDIAAVSVDRKDQVRVGGSEGLALGGWDDRGEVY